MAFKSLHFGNLFPIVVGPGLAPARERSWIYLGAANVYFCMAWRPAYVVPLLFALLVVARDVGGREVASFRA